MRLEEEECEPIDQGATPLTADEAEALLPEAPGWTLNDSTIMRELEFDTFREAIDFVDGVADLAESQDHHPDIYISFKNVRLELSTHMIAGLSRNDFILAAKINELV
jgi:4a-hydroxytetrahydrobiopterin dehydratase